MSDTTTRLAIVATVVAIAIIFTAHLFVATFTPVVGQ